MEGVDVGMVSGHLGMPGILVDVVYLGILHHIVPGDGHINLSEEIVKEMDKATENLKNAMGSNCDLWQGTNDSRIF